MGRAHGLFTAVGSSGQLVVARPQIGQITAMRQHRPALSPHLSPLRDFSRCDIVTRMTGQSDNRSGFCPRDFSTTSHPPVHPVTTVVGPVRSQTRYSGLLPGLTSSPLTALVHCHCAESARVGRMVHRVQSPPVSGSATAAEELVDERRRGSILGEVDVAARQP